MKMSFLPNNELAATLTVKIAAGDRHFAIDLGDLLAEQSDETLNALLAYTEGYTELCWSSLSSTLHSFINDGGVPNNVHLVKDGLTQSAFSLHVAFSLTPVAVEHHKSMVGSESQSYDGALETFSEEDMLEAVTSSIYSLMSDLLPDESSVRLLRACYLIELYGRRGEVPLPSGADFLWIADHALEIVKLEENEDVFPDGMFDRERAETLLKVEVPLREGVL